MLVYFDAQAGQQDDEDVVVTAYTIDHEKIGASLVSLRQGDDDIDNVRKGSCLL